MPETVEILEDLGVIKVESYGKVTAADLKQSMIKVNEINKDRGFYKVFVDATRETSLPSPIYLFQFGSDLIKVIGSLKFAVAVSQNLMTSETAKEILSKVESQAKALEGAISKE